MPEPRLLNSWKEIASYLCRGIRTVQRWELELGLPVRRPHGRERSSVIAYSNEIDEWLLKSPSGRFHQQQPERYTRPQNITDFSQNARSRERVHESLAALREQVVRLRQQMDRASNIVKKIQEMDRAGNVVKDDDKKRSDQHELPAA
jgi:hypothetical protein